MSPLLSVVVPCYNVAAYLPDCLDSILNQTLTDLEVIVVDDGSPDECGEIADDYAERDERVQVLHIDNVGLGMARNVGTKSATGRYLTFIDSDDLVPPRAFEQMVRTLETTGSDFCAGNAWQFSRSIGTRPSWTHRPTFARTRLRTHISEFPILMRDRMIWNKVYRRSFWDEKGYEFPDIRYEDYPVTLKAHLEASSVDVLSPRVYMWRQRESGDSITQDFASLNNATDRVTSASKVLNVVSEQAPPDVHDLVHAYMTDIDLVAVAEAMVEAHPDDKAEAQELLYRLAQDLKLGTAELSWLPELMLRAAQQRDFEAVEHMIRRRKGGRRRDLVLGLARSGRWDLVRRSVVIALGRRIPKNPFRIKSLRSHIVRSHTVGFGMAFQVRVWFNKALASRAKTDLRLITEHGATPIDHYVQRDAKGLVLTAFFPTSMADELHPGETGHLKVSARLGVFRWSSMVELYATRVPAPLYLRPDARLLWSRSSNGDGTLCISQLDDPPIANAFFTERSVIVSVPDRDGHVAIQRPWPTPPVVVGIDDDHSVEIMFSDIVADDAADNAFSGEAARTLFMVDEAVDLTYLCVDDEWSDPLGDALRRFGHEHGSSDQYQEAHAVSTNPERDDRDQDSCIQPLIYVGGAGSQYWNGYLFTIRRGARGEMVLFREPSEPPNDSQPRS